jgi:hypothetical protein
MSDLGDFAEKAEKFGKDHPDQVDKVVGEAEKAANDRTGNKYDKQIQQGGEQVEKRFGAGQDQQQDQQSQQQDPQNQQQGQ